MSRGLGDVYKRQVHYCSQPGRFFSVSGEAGEEALEYELTRIVETRLGLVCAHEGVEP